VGKEVCWCVTPPRSQDHKIWLEWARAERAIKAYYQRLILLRKGISMKKRGTYICQVSIHACWSWCITFIPDRSMSHRHLFLSGLLSPHHLDSVLSSLIYLFLSASSSPHLPGSVFSNHTSVRERLWALTSWVVCFLTLPIFECALEPSTTLGSVFSNLTSF